MRKIVLLLFGAVFASLFVMAQGKKISGKVTDGSGNPVPGASVLVKGTTKGTSTDATGSFELAISANAKTLVISAVGFDNEEISIGSNTSFSVSLKASSGQEMSEVIVTGVAGATTRKKMTVY